MEIKIALALNQNEFFDNRYFGEAEMFVVFRFNGEKFLREETLQNPYKAISGKTNHEIKIKGEGIVDFLRKKNVSVIISTQFGRNIRMVNKYFIPVIVSGEEPERVINLLLKYLHWIKDEIQNKPDRYKLFTINKGILKTTIDQK